MVAGLEGENVAVMPGEVLGKSLQRRDDEEQGRTRNPLPTATAIFLLLLYQLNLFGGIYI